MGLPILTLCCGCNSNSSQPSNPGPPPAPLQTQQSSAKPSTEFTTGDFEGCPPEGDGGDPDLNRLKNRDLPPESYSSKIIEQILADHPSLAEQIGKANRAEWSDEARQEVAERENRGVTVEGYLIKVKQEGQESCNCHRIDRRDYHLWLVSDPANSRDISIIAEVSPRAFATHSNWRLHILQRLAKDNARVRISGWIMWDQEHPDQVGQTRGTLWEVHPIHKIEVYSGGEWVNLDD